MTRYHLAPAPLPAFKPNGAVELPEPKPREGWLTLAVVPGEPIRVVIDGVTVAEVALSRRGRGGGQSRLWMRGLPAVKFLRPGVEAEVSQ